MGWQEVLELILDDVQRLGNGAELDSDATFAERAGCSVPTVKRAMAELARRGFVDRRKGQRTLASERSAVVSGSDFSFSRSAKEHGAEIVTNLIEKSCRLPSRTSAAGVEMRAQKALGLNRSQPFFIVARRRILDGSPRVIHRSYLNPSHYPAAFLAKHDFEAQSLFDILEMYGLRIHSRETRIRAVLPTDAERDLLAIENEPVLSVEQSLRAFCSASDRLVTAEYLHATYSHWEYVINDRR